MIKIWNEDSNYFSSGKFFLNAVWLYLLGILINVCYILLVIQFLGIKCFFIL